VLPSAPAFWRSTKGAVTRNFSPLATVQIHRKFNSMRRDNAAPTKIAGVFVFLALGFAWVYWLLISLSQKGSLPFSMQDSVPGAILKAILRDFGPAVAAIVVEAFYQGSAGLKRLWLTVTRWRVSWRLYALAFVGPMIAAGLVVSIGVMKGSLKRNLEPISIVHFALVFFAMVVLGGPLGEEVGWRGLLLPQLLREMGPIAASIAVGGVWWLWHVPLYRADGRISTTGDWIDFLIDTLALSIIFTWFFLRSGCSEAGRKCDQERALEIFEHRHLPLSLALIVGVYLRFTGPGVARRTIAVRSLYWRPLCTGFCPLWKPRSGPLQNPVLALPG